MDRSPISSLVAIALFFGIIMALFMVAYEDKDVFSLIRKYLCKVGIHKTHRKIGRVKRHKYYCEFCKKPRKYPKMKLLDGGKRIGNNRFRF